MLTSPLRPTDQLNVERPRPDVEFRRSDDDYPVTVRRPVRVVVRQRRVVATLATVSLLSGLVATLTHAAVGWAFAALAVVLMVGYMGIVARIRRMAVEREMTLAFGTGRPLADDWDAFGRDLAVAVDATHEPVLEATAERGTVAKFVLASMLGWLLTPVVAIIRLACGDLSDLRRRGILDRLVRAQQYGRSRSLQVLSVSVAATASVTGVTMAASSSLAGANPVPATAPLRAAGTATAAGSAYTVRAGDTLTAIAQQYGVPVSMLASANGIANPDRITTGQVLRIQVPPYTVRPGDTLSAIAARFGRSVPALAASNGVADANVITVGQVLHVGGGNLPAVARIAAGPVAVAPVVARTPSAPPLVGSGTYTVRAGDTLGAIAAKFDTWTSSLVAANHLASANQIVVGQVLQVGGQGANAPKPAPAPAPAAAPVVAHTPAAPPLVGSGTYTVRAGDTLGAIAAKFDTWTSSLVAANHLASANAIVVGQVLQVGGQGANAPKPAPAPAPAPAPVVEPIKVQPVVAAAPAPVVHPAPAPAPAPVRAASGAAVAVQTALAQVGTPYVYGGAAPGGFDCSGLVMYAWGRAGVSLPHYSGAQYSAMAHIPMSALQPGDVVFFADPGQHEAMYIGNGMIVEAPYTGADVRVIPMYSQFVLAGRP